MPVITHNTKLILWPRGSYIECDLYCGIVGGIVPDMDLYKPNITFAGHCTPIFTLSNESLN